MERECCEDREEGNKREGGTCVWEKSLTAEDPLLFRISPSVTNAWFYSLPHTSTYKDAESALCPLTFLWICKTGWHPNTWQHQWARMCSPGCVDVLAWLCEERSSFQQEHGAGERDVRGASAHSCIHLFRGVLVQCEHQIPNIGLWLTVCVHVSAIAALLSQQCEPGSLPGLSAWLLPFYWGVCILFQSKMDKSMQQEEQSPVCILLCRELVSWHFPDTKMSILIMRLPKIDGDVATPGLRSSMAWSTESAGLKKNPLRVLPEEKPYHPGPEDKDARFVSGERSLI